MRRFLTSGMMLSLMVLLGNRPVVFGQDDFKNGAAAFKNGQYEQAVNSFQTALTAYTSAKKQVRHGGCE